MYKRQSIDTQHEVSADAPSTRYSIFTKPSYQHWLFGLDLATTKQSGIQQHPDFTLYSTKVVAQSTSYDVTSYIDMPLELNLSSDKKNNNLLLPVNSNPRLIALSQTLRSQYRNNEQLIQAVLTHFNEQPYRYTLQPPTLEGHTLDKFYFDTQAGFCGHYASTFAFIMRAVGIPARLVTGYMGAEYNLSLIHI